MENWSIKELKQVLIKANIAIPSGIEKSELVKLAQTAAASVASRKILSPYPRFKHFGAKLEECEAIFVFFHGYGADEHQFDFFQDLVKKKICFICPKSLDDGWWPLDIPEWAMAMHSGRLMEKIKETPRGLKEARDKGKSFIHELRQRAPPGSALLLGGFSQGAVMAIDLALAMDPGVPIHLASFSAFLVDIGEWTERAKLHGGNIRALVTHGAADPLIPFEASNLLASLLKGGGIEVMYESHRGGHTLGDDKILRKCGEFFDGVCV